MPRRRTRRVLALFALALALLAALPCAALAGGDSCCGAMSDCGDASGSPCAQFAAVSCCEPPQTPVGASVAPQLPASPLDPLAPALAEFVPRPLALAVSRRPAPLARTAHVAMRDVLLRL